MIEASGNIHPGNDKFGVIIKKGDRDFFLGRYKSLKKANEVLDQSLKNLKKAPSQEVAAEKKHVGIYPKKNGYTAKITIKGKTTYVGTFKTLEEAIDARQLKLESL